MSEENLNACETVALDADLDDYTFSIFEGFSADAPPATGAAPVLPVPDAPADLKLPESTQTVYYVNFTPSENGLPDDVVKELRTLQQNVLDCRSWATLMTNSQVSRKLKTGELKENDKDGIGSYRAKVMETVLRTRTTWLAAAVDVQNTESLTVKSSEFHTEILKLAMKGFPIPAAVVANLEEILLAVVKSIMDSKTYEHKKAVQYWIQTTVFVYDKMSKNIQPKLRTINFQSNARTYEVSARKSSYSEATIKMSFSGQETDFNNKIWEGVMATINEEAIKKGKELSKDDPNFDVPL